MSNETRARFIEAVRSIESALEGMGFTQVPPVEQGFATWVSFRKSNCEVKFVCGPPEYHVEMFIEMRRVSGVKAYEFSDLMQMPTLARWIRANRLVVQEDDQLCVESRWFAELLRLALPVLDKQL